MSANGRDCILVIDDDADFREMIQFMAEMVGKRLLTADTCCAGLKVLEEHEDEIGVVLLDYFMPGMTPTDCAKSIKAKTDGKIRVILLTAAPDPQERADELQLSHWLGKPFDFSAFKDAVNVVPAP